MPPAERLATGDQGDAGGESLAADLVQLRAALVTAAFRTQELEQALALKAAECIRLKARLDHRNDLGIGHRSRRHTED